MNDYNFRYSKKDSVARAIVNAAVFAGAAGIMWILLIGADKFLQLI